MNISAYSNRLAACVLLAVGTLAAAQTNTSLLNSAKTPDSDENRAREVSVVNVPQVTLANSPTVKLAPGTSVALSGTASVQIVNSTGNPVPVQEVSTANRTPFQAEIIINLTNGASSDAGFVAVPSGKRLVIEYASAVASAPPGQKLIFLISNGGVNHVVAAIGVETPTQALFTAGQTVKVYSNPPGSPVSLQLVRDQLAGSANAGFSISGYLEDAQ